MKQVQRDLSMQSVDTPHSDGGSEDWVLSGSERWYAVHTLPQREATAQMHLKNQAFRTFFPRFEKTVRHARKTRRILAPLFCRYLFVVLDPGRDRWRSINGTMGVSSLVTMAGKPIPVPKGIVETLIASSSSENRMDFRPSLTPGQKVRLVSGPFADQLGVFEQLDDGGRVRVLLEMMGGWHPLQLSRDDVLAAA